MQRPPQWILTAAIGALFLAALGGMANQNRNEKVKEYFGSIVSVDAQNDFAVRIIETDSNRTVFLTPKTQASDGITIVGIDFRKDGWDQVFWNSYPLTSTREDHHYSYNSGLSVSRSGKSPTTQPIDQSKLKAAINALNQAVKETM